MKIMSLDRNNTGNMFLNSFEMRNPIDLSIDPSRQSSPNMGMHDP
jgi:hypothetical protein